MEWQLLVTLTAVALVVAAGGAWWAARSAARRGPEPEMRLPPPRCLRCRGTGWLNRDPERTLTFTGDGFEDRHTPATVCPECGGTGLGRWS